jgi:Mg-chelatase subunit ChlD
MYGKKIIASLVLVSVMVVSAAMFAAFEAHVINVTAKIENALTVPIDHIDFGTVFPQEQLDRYLDINLSQSFMDEDRVDDVEYMIRQKPKCGWTKDNGTVLLDLPTMSGHVNDQGVAECPPAPVIDPAPPTNAVWGQLPLLCPYLSKHKAPNDPDDNQAEVQVDAFHQPWYIDASSGQLVYTEAKGRLAKSDGDTVDNWVIDLKVPCFGDHCAQDWADFVERINPGTDSTKYVQPIANEHKIFGCDLWVEVTEVSEKNGEDLACVDADVMLVLDRSGSIDASELTILQNAAKNFVTALGPTATGVHMGQTSFETIGTHDLNLTSDTTLINGAIDGLTSGNLTNLESGILLASAELAGPRNRDNTNHPNYMVVITDGAPTASDGLFSDEIDAANAADAARAAGTKIYVVGVGTTAATATYLSTEIANHTGQYYDAADYASLSAVLSNIATCNK